MTNRLRYVSSFLLLCMFFGNGAWASPPLKLYAARANFDFLTLSPDGSKYAGIVGEEAAASLQIAALPSNNVIINSPFKKVSIAGVAWVGQDHLLLTTRETSVGGDGVMRFGYTAQHLDLRKSSWNVLLKNSSQGFIYIAETPEARVIDGHPFAFITTYPTDYNAVNRIIVRVDLDSGRVVTVETGNKRTMNWVINSKGRATGRADFDQASGRWELFGRASDAADWKLMETIIESIDVPALLSVGKSDDEVIYTRQVNEVWTAHSLNLITGKVAILDSFDTSGVVVDRSSGRAIASVNETLEGPVTEFNNPDDQKLWRSIIRVWPEDHVRFQAWSDDRNIVLVSVEGRATEAGVYLVNRAAKTAQRLIDDGPKLTLDDVVEPKIIRFPARDGVTVPAYLALPRGKPEKKLPLIVVVASGNLSRATDTPMQAIASRGYAVLQMPERGLTAYGKAFAGTSHDATMFARANDIIDGVRSLTDAGTIDPNRVCVIGYDYGGSAALLAASQQGQNFRCVAGAVGIYDFRKHLQYFLRLAGPSKDSSSYRRVRERLGVSGPDDPKLEAQSPVSHAKDVQSPVLIVQLKSDAGQGDAMADALQNGGHIAERHVMSVDDWRFSNPGRIEMLETVVAFIEKHNPPSVASPSPAGE